MMAMKMGISNPGGCLKVGQTKYEEKNTGSR